MVFDANITGAGCGEGQETGDQKFDKVEVDLEKIWLPEYPAGEFGEWFRPIVLDAISSGAVGPLTIKDMFRTLMEKEYTLFEKIALAVIGLTDLKYRREQMRLAHQVWRTHIPMVESLAGRKIPGMKERTEALEDQIMQITAEIFKQESTDARKISSN